MKRRIVVTGPKCPPFQDVPLKVRLTIDFLVNIYEAVEGCLSVDVREIPSSGKDKVMNQSCKAERGSKTGIANPSSFLIYGTHK